MREIAEWHCAARVCDEAERAQLARGEREKRLDGVCGEVHRVDLLPGLRPRAACEVPEGTRNVTGVQRGLEGDVLDAGSAVLGLNMEGDEEDQKASGVCEGERREADVEGLFAKESAGEGDGPACCATVCTCEGEDFLPDLGRDTLESSYSRIHCLGSP